MKTFSGRGAEIKHIYVTTRADNDARKLYQSVLKAETEFTIPNLYSADEVMMIARNFSKKFAAEQ
jgi:hypothetical protein